MNVRKVVSFNRSRRESCFEAALVSTHAEATANICRHVAKMPGGAGGSMQDDAVHHGCASHSGPKGEQYDIATASGCTPQGFSYQRSARIVVGAHGEITANQIFQRRSFQKVKIAMDAINPRRLNINDPLAPDADASQRRRGFAQNRVNKGAQGICAGWRRGLECLDLVPTHADNRGLDGGSAYIDTQSEWDLTAARNGFAHNSFALYAACAILRRLNSEFECVSASFCAEERLWKRPQRMAQRCEANR